MKKFIILFITFYIANTFAQTDFITRWNLATAGSGATQIQFNATVATGGTTFTWQEISPGAASGGGTLTAGTSLRTVTGLPSGSIVRLTISNTNLQRFFINSTTDRNRLIDVEQWGTANWTNMSNAFYGCSNLGISATDAPNLSGVTNMSQMFRGCTLLNGPANINSWNTSSVTNMSNTFYQAAAFNQNIGSWNVGNVTNISNMFQGASAFNQNIGSWNVGSVTNANGMFRDATAFNQNIGGWNVANVTNMSNMFRGTNAFNQNIGGWNVANVTNMSTMFYQALAFNQNIGGWNTSSVTNMSSMFQGTLVFNQNISGWNTSSVTDMGAMFRDAAAFNQNISGWNTSSVTDMSNMFRATGAFNQNIGAWNTANVTNMGSMFQDAVAFNQNISTWNTTNVTTMANMFRGSLAFNQSLNSWNIANVTNMNSMFLSAAAFNQSLAAWAASLNPAVSLTNFLNNCGMSVINYDATLVAFNNFAPNGLSMGATNMRFCTATAERTNLTTVKSWTIAGDLAFAPSPGLLSSGNNAVATDYCSFFLNPNNPGQKLINVDPNGNTFSPNFIAINNNNIGALPAGVNSVNGYYQINDATNTMRIYNQIVSISAPGSFTTNGGVIVRVYFSQTVINSMLSDIAPVGTIVHSGWYKSAFTTAAEVIGNMKASRHTLNSAIQISPTATGIEGGINYAEFTLTSFSSIGFFAKTDLIVLPVSLVNFDMDYANCLANLHWSTADEFNFSHFEIEQSLNNIDFENVGIVPSAGGFGLKTYSFTHQPAAPIVYYRLKMVDLDGSFTYSPLVAYNGNECNSSFFAPAISPNPVEDYLFVQTAEQSVIRVYQTDGKLLLTYTHYTPNSPIDLSNLAAGVYVVEAVSPLGNVTRQKVQKL